jgi:chemotaxis protein CheD
MESGLHFSNKTYFDRTFNAQAVKILPGEYHVTGNDIMISTVLGSCVSVCIRDRISGVGGMNHFMLPGDRLKQGRSLESSARYGTHAMELLFNHYSKLGGNLTNLEAKVFGAGKVMDGMSDVGRQNADFALQYLKARNIQVVAVDIGDIHPRKVIFIPRTGQAFVKRIRNQTLQSAGVMPD